MIASLALVELSCGKTPTVLTFFIRLQKQLRDLSERGEYLISAGFRVGSADKTERTEQRTKVSVDSFGHTKAGSDKIAQERPRWCCVHYSQRGLKPQAVAKSHGHGAAAICTLSKAYALQAMFWESTHR